MAGHRRFFAGDMWAVYNFANPNERYAKFLSNAKPRFANLFDGLLLNDEVVVPTQDFVSLAVLVGVLGERPVLEMLERGDLTFARLLGSFAYVGNGGGLLPFKIWDSKAGIPDPFSAPDEVAIRWALAGLTVPPKDPALARLAAKATRSMKAVDMGDTIRQQTYADLAKSVTLREHFHIRDRVLDRLDGIKPDQVRIWGGPDNLGIERDEIEAVLSASAANVELHLAGTLECDDMSTATPIGHLLKAKADQMPKTAEPFATLKELANVPDLTKPLSEKPVEERAPFIGQLLKLKHSSEGEAFRRWFHENASGSGTDLRREYVKVLEHVPLFERTSTRVLRYLVCTAVGFVPALGPAAGVALGAADAFILPRLFRGHSPKFFFESLSQLVPDDKAEKP